MEQAQRLRCPRLWNPTPAAFRRRRGTSAPAAAPASTALPAFRRSARWRQGFVQTISNPTELYKARSSRALLRLTLEPARTCPGDENFTGVMWS